MQIRPLLPDEMEPCRSLVRSVFDRFEAPDYSREGAASFYAFLDSVPEQFSSGALKIRAALREDRLIGVLAMRDGRHICLLFVDPSFHRQGIARALVQTAADFARENGQKQLTVNSSPYAVPVYHRLGFSDLSAEQTADGIRFAPMRCLL